MCNVRRHLQTRSGWQVNALVGHGLRRPTPYRLPSLPNDGIVGQPGNTRHGGLLLVVKSGIIDNMEPTIKRITIEPTVCQGQPCVRGLRIPVSVVLRYLADGKSPAEIIDEFPELEVEDVSECLRYAAWLASGRVLELPPAA